MKNKINKLFGDPSATGVSGACLVNSRDEITLLKFGNEKDESGNKVVKDWKKHFEFYLDLVRKHSVNLFVCETSSYISNTSSDIRKLIGLVGAIQVLPYFFPNLKVKVSPSDQTKRLWKKIVNKQKGIAGLVYQRGKAWNYRGQKISTHELDAFLVYWIWKGNNCYEN